LTREEEGVSVQHCLTPKYNISTTICGAAAALSNLTVFGGFRRREINSTTLHKHE